MTIMTIDEHAETGQDIRQGRHYLKALHWRLKEHYEEDHIAVLRIEEALAELHALRGDMEKQYREEHGPDERNAYDPQVAKEILATGQP